MSDSFKSVLVEADRRRAARDIETLRQAIRELTHAVWSGPSWFTNGIDGQRSHAGMWVDRANEAIKEIEDTLTQAQDCIRGETPEDCSPEEAREDTLRRIRRALNL